MVRLLQCGWETGDASQLGMAQSVGSYAAPAAVSAAPTARSGTYCIKCTNNSSSFTGWPNASKWTVMHASKTELYWAFGLYRSDGELNTFPSRLSFAVFDTSGSVGLVLATEDDGSVRLYVATAGTGQPTAANMTLIGTSATSIPNSTWVNVEVHATAATGATGAVEVKINGASVISATSQRTCQTSANFAGMLLQFMRLNATGASTSSYLAFDDLRVNDTTGSVNTGWPGDEQILLLRPNAAGDSAQFTRGGSDSGTNYGQVDELPPSNADYVYSTTTGHIDLYNLSTTTVVSISAIEVLVQAYNVDGPGGSINLVTKTPAGQSDGSAQNLSGSPMYLRRVLDTDPADSGTWTQAKLDALQIGPKVAS